MEIEPKLSENLLHARHESLCHTAEKPWTKPNHPELIWFAVTLTGVIFPKVEVQVVVSHCFTGLNLPRIWSILFRLPVEESKKPAF